VTSTEALIAHLKLAIEKLRRELYGSRSERKARLLDQMELELEELEAAASEDERAARAVSTEAVAAFERKRPSRRPFPTHLPRGASSSPLLSAAPAAGRRGCRSSARTSPRRWK
jgi:transposase